MPFRNYIAILKEKGLIVTQQRIEILKYLDESKNYRTHDDIYNYMIIRFPSVSKSTIYNNIESLEEMGLLKSVRFSNSTQAHIDTSFEPHFNFVCKICGKILEVESNMDFMNTLKNSGHDCDEFVFTIYGTCNKCKVKLDQPEIPPNSF